MSTKESSNLFTKLCDSDKQEKKTTTEIIEIFLGSSHKWTKL